MANEKQSDRIVAALEGRVDSGNAAQVEREILAKLPQDKTTCVVLDAEKLEYISSAGLRVILRLKKSYSDLQLVNVSPEVYDILEMTGFTEMMSVGKAYRVVSVEGCEVIGEGYNGKVYRIDRDNVVKTYKNADALAEIQHEREVAKLALILGVPTAISYDVVRVGDSYGSVFELLNAKSFSKILASEPERFDWCVSESVGMLKKIHAITVPSGKLPSAREKMLGKVERMKDLLPDGLGDKLKRLAEEIPESDRMIHGDFHTKNIVLAGDEVLVIDMDTLAVGHPIFDLVSMYNAYVGYSEYDSGIVLRFQGYPAEISRRFWHDTLAAYLNTGDEEKIREVEEKVRCLSYAYLIARSIRHGSADEQTVDLWKNRLIELLRRTDTLLFDPGTERQPGSDALEIDAAPENLQAVTDYIHQRLTRNGCPAKVLFRIDLAVEEVFVNIAHYAYTPGTGKAWIRAAVSEDRIATIVFADRGAPYDPLKKEDPDVTLTAEDRQIGGLGIFLTKQIMDDVSYEYKDGQNILTLRKKI